LVGTLLPWVVGWAIRNENLGGNATNRTLVWHPITASNFDTALYNVSTFLMPVEAWRRELFKTPVLFVAAVIIILGAVLIWTLVKTKRTITPLRSANPSGEAKGNGAAGNHKSSNSLVSELNGKGSWTREIVAFTSGLYIFGYLASIFASISFFDASTKFKPRILSPIYVSLLILLVVFGLWLWRQRREVAIVFVLLVFGLSVVGQYATVTELAKGGQGYASFQWYDSKTMAFLRSLAPQAMIYTNQPTAVYLYTGRGAYVLPDRLDPVTTEQRPGFDKGVEEMQTQIKAGKAVLALFSGDDPTPSDAALMSSGLYLAQKSAGDEVYTAAP
jgi:hypothetical protein